MHTGMSWVLLNYECVWRQHKTDREKKASFFLTFLIKNVNVCFQCNRHLISNQISHTEAFIRTRFTATQNRKPMNNFCIVFETS